MEVIDNNVKTMVDALKESLANSDSIDILTAYFYFSGFAALADELKDKKMRILIGKAVDPDVVDLYYQATKKDAPEGVHESLDAYAIKDFGHLKDEEKKKKYIDGFCEMFNKASSSGQFDSITTQNAYKIFLDKLDEGTLEIKLIPNDHAKAYILTNKHTNSSNPDQDGTVFFGSSNFTYNGLCGQGELNERFTDNERYNTYHKMFEGKWTCSRAIEICAKDGDRSFIEEFEKKTWVSNVPAPYKIYVRILHEMFATYENEPIETPNYISGGKFDDYKYQIDAIKFGIDSLKKNNGVIIADVVGLGKSIIASAIAYNLNFKHTVIIAPPHLVDQWEDYQQDFSLRGVEVFSSGKLNDAYEKCTLFSDPVLYIIDEAHRYRNESTQSYKLIHQLTRSNSDNKVVLLTATPYNNRPDDLYALVKLFQIPNKATISSIENLGFEFKSLIYRYKSLEDKWRSESNHVAKEVIKQDLNHLSGDIRALISPVTIRRSRIDLHDITEYADDLSAQHIEFPKVVGPELVEYDLGSIRPLYMETLKTLTTDFKCVRYNPSDYFKDPKAINRRYGRLLGQMNIELMSRNLSGFIKNLLVMRFESSKAAFKITLENIIKSYENIVKWWEKGYVPIQKHGYFEDPDLDEIQEIMAEIDSLEDEDIDIDKIKKKKKALPIETPMFTDEYIPAVESDLRVLKDIHDKWFVNDKNPDFDPKYDKVREKIDELQSDKSRKIVIFSSYADTAKYVQNKLESDGYKACLYTGDSDRRARKVVIDNFDAAVATEQQSNDYDILVATDALSEGINLNRAGAVINYDIPYNPTRVVQRIGRINRINKKVFDEIYIYNFFPTDVGEENAAIREISTLKMYLINNVVGSDTRILTPDETLESYFKSEYKRADEEYNEKSWDVDYRNLYNSIKSNEPLMKEVCEIPEFVRIIRKGQESNCIVSVSKKGDNYVFAQYNAHGKFEIKSPESMLSFFRAEENEIGYKADTDLNKKFEIIQRELTRPSTLDKIKGHRKNALSILTRLKYACEEESAYLDDLSNVIKRYDDLSDGELKYIANLEVGRSTAAETCIDLKREIPEHYISQIIKKAENIDSRKETIMFTEALRK